MLAYVALMFAGSILVAGTCVRQAQAQVSIRILSAAINQAVEVSSNPGLPETQKVARLSAIACQAFDVVLKDGGLKERLSKRLGSPQGYYETLNDLRTNSAALGESLRFEEAQLKRAGVKSIAANEAIQSILLLTEIGQNKYLSYNGVISIIQRSRDSACTVMKSSVEKLNEDKAFVMVRKIGSMIIGVGVMTVDAFWVPPTA